MRILVIGGNRFFGKRLVSKLLESKTDVTLLNRGQLGDPFGEQVKRITADRKQLSREMPQLKNEKWDVVFDQACYEADDARKSCQTFSGLVNHYIFTSSASVYDWNANLNEKDFDPATYQFHADADRNINYAEAKRQCETVFTQQNAFPVTSFRFPFVVGNDDYTGRLRFHIDRIMSGQPLYFPNIEAKISFISSEDAAQALFFSATLKNAVGPLNCASPEPLSLRSLVSMIEEISKRKATILSQKDEKSHSPYGVEKDWWMRVDKMIELGFLPTDLKEWLPQLVESEIALSS